MALTAAEIEIAREILAEIHAHLFVDREVGQRADGSIVRYWPSIPETYHDICMEYMRRWVSTNNQNVLVVSGVVHPIDANGDWYDSGEVAYTQDIFIHENGLYELRVILDTGLYYWQLNRLSDSAQLWISNGTASVVGIGSVASWTPTEVLHGDPYDGLMVADYWEFNDDGIIEPVTGALVCDYTAPSSGIEYRSVTNPQVNNGKIRHGIYRADEFRIVYDYDGRYKSLKGWAMLQTLELELNVAAPITEAGTKWRVKAGTNYQSGSKNVVLEILYCDPKYIQEMAEENGEATYTDSIYTINAGVLEGKWFTVRQIPVIDEKTGFGTITWFLSQHFNTDLIFSYRASPTELVADFFKLHMLPTSIATFEAQYYFDASGNFYVSSNGTTYTNKNGTAATGSLPADADLLGTVVNGRRIVQYSQDPNQENGEINLHLKLIFTTDASYDGGDGNPMVTFGEPEEQILIQEDVVSEDLPNGGSPDLGSVEAGGRSKTVTRYDNFQVVDGKYHYRKMIFKYVAPQNDADAWYFMGSAALTEREKRTFYNAITDNAGNAGWEPIDVGGTGGPKVHLIELPEWRTKVITRQGKFFVRRPTTADLSTASITAPSAPANPQGPYIVDDVKQVGQHLFLYERVTTTLGSKAADADAVTSFTNADWITSGQLT